MKRFLALIITAIIVALASGIIFSWLSQIRLNHKARTLSNEVNGGQTTVANLFNIQEGDFFCLEKVYQDRPSESHDYSSIVKEGMKVEDIPNYNRWPFEMVFWDPDDVRVMTLSKTGKLRRKHLFSSNTISSDTWPHHFGCFSSNHAIKVTFSHARSKKEMKLEFPDVVRNESQK